MITFSILALNKNDIVAFSAAYATINLPLRMSALLLSGRGPRLAEWVTYIAIATTSFVGFSIGMRLRRSFDSAAILRLLLTFVFLSSGILLGMLDDARVAYGMGAVALAIALLVMAAMRWPLSLSCRIDLLRAFCASVLQKCPWQKRQASDVPIAALDAT